MSGHNSSPRWGQPLTGIIATVVLGAIAVITWIILASPNGIFGFYEHPMIEFLAWMILVGLWQTIIFGNWPFQNMPPVKRGVVQTIINVVASYIIIYGVFNNFFGKLVLPLWSVDALVARGIAEETAVDLTGGAITMFVLIGFFTYAFWTIAFQKWPWAGKLSQPALGLAEWGLTTTVTIICYGLIIFPFYIGVALKQPVAAQTLWWSGTGVNHLYWAVGIWEWAIVYLFMTANIWAGKPWDLAKKQPLRGLFAVVGIFILSYITVQILLVGMNAFWGPVDPKAGADGIHSLLWRYYDAASIGGFTLFPFLIWNHYFDNWPQKWGTVKGWLFRTVGVFVFAAIGYFLYYAVTGPILGLKPTLSNTVNKPLVWLFWAIIPLLFNDWFMEKVPFYSSGGETHTLPQGQAQNKTKGM